MNIEQQPGLIREIGSSLADFSTRMRENVAVGGATVVAAMAPGLSQNAEAAGSETTPYGSTGQVPTCQGEKATIYGTEKSERLDGTDGNDVIVGLGGDDRIYGRGGDDLLCGDEGDDRLYGSRGDDSLYGGSGSDRLSANAGNDLLSSGGGKNDRLYGGPGDDELIGRSGTGRLKGNSGNDWCRGSKTKIDCESTYSRDLKRVPGISDKTGSGRTYRYKVLAEEGIAIDREEVGEKVEDVLADSRGWTRSGKVAFQRVTNNANTNIILATPDRVDRLCAPLDTAGRVSCRQGNNVVLNLNRWRHAVGHWTGSKDEYRTMLVNHEMGHRIGKGHGSCSGKGNRAPVMQQQTYFLKGCKANPWPLGSELGGL